MKSRSRTPFAAAALLLALAGCDNPSDSAGPIDHVEVASGDLQTGTAGTQLAQPLVVRVLDDDGDPVAGQLLSFVVTAGGGQLGAASLETISDGTAQNSWTLGPAAGDTQRVEVRATDPETGALRVYASFRAVGAPGAAAVLQPVGAPARFGARSTAPADSLAVRVRDALGNAVPGATVTWAVTAGGGIVSPAQSTSGADGIARARWTLGTSTAEQRATATLGAAVVQFTAQALTAENTFVTSAPDFPRIALPGQTVTASFRVTSDAAGSTPRAGVPVFFTAQGSGSAAPAVAVTDAQGIASTQWTLANGLGGQEITARVGEVAYTRAVEAYQPGVPWELIVTPLDLNVPSGGGETIHATVLDRAGTPVPGAQVTWTVLEGNGSFTPAQNTTDAQGTASATLNAFGEPGPLVRFRVATGSLAHEGRAHVVPGPSVRFQAAPAASPSPRTRAAP
jgi:adhesin/invasin